MISAGIFWEAWVIEIGMGGYEGWGLVGSCSGRESEVETAGGRVVLKIRGGRGGDACLERWRTVLRDEYCGEKCRGVLDDGGWGERWRRGWKPDDTGGGKLLRRDSTPRQIQ